MYVVHPNLGVTSTKPLPHLIFPNLLTKSDNSVAIIFTKTMLPGTPFSWGITLTDLLDLKNIHLHKLGFKNNSRDIVGPNLYPIQSCDEYHLLT